MEEGAAECGGVVRREGREETLHSSVPSRCFQWEIYVTVTLRSMEITGKPLDFYNKVVEIGHCKDQSGAGATKNYYFIDLYWMFVEIWVILLDQKATNIQFTHVKQKPHPVI